MNKFSLILILALLMPAVALANYHYGYTAGSVSVIPTTVAPGDYITVEFEYKVQVQDYPTSLWAVIFDGANGMDIAYEPVYEQLVLEYGVPLDFDIPSAVYGDNTYTFSELTGNAIVVQIPETAEAGQHSINIFSCAASWQPVSNFAWYQEDYPGGGAGPIIITVEQDVIEVGIDIKPGSYPNSINLGSFGVVPVAILSTETFDATQVDPGTVTLAGADVAVRGKSNKLMAHQEDINDDGLPDLVCQVETENLDPGQFQDGHAILEGNLLPEFEGTPISGMDDITIVPPAE